MSVLTPARTAQCNGVPGSNSIDLPCSHRVTVEQASAFEALLVDWLASINRNSLGAL
jgi:hypothetical protein